MCVRERGGEEVYMKAYIYIQITAMMDLFFHFLNITLRYVTYQRVCVESIHLCPQFF